MLAKIIYQNKEKIFLFLFLLNILFFGFQYIRHFETRKLKEKIQERNRKRNFLSLNILTPVDEFRNLSSGRNLVLRLMRNDCSECLDSIFSNTLRLTKSLGKNSVHVMVSNDYTESQFIGFSRIYQYDLNIYFVPEQITSVDKRGYSYYFIVDKKKYPQLAKDIYEIKTTADAGHTTHYDEWIIGI